MYNILFVNLFWSSPCSPIACHEKAANDRDLRQILDSCLKGQLYEHHFDTCWRNGCKWHERVGHFFWICYQVCNRVYTPEYEKLQLLGQRKESCCRSVLLMNYDTQLQDLKRCQAKRIFQASFICHLVCLCNNRQRKWTMYTFFNPQFVIQWKTILYFFFFFWVCSFTKRNKKKNTVSVL